MIWNWMPPIVDCAGMPEQSALVYRGMVSQLVIVGEIINLDGEPVPIYQHLEPVEAFRTPETIQEYELPTPAVGEVALLSIEATDEAGNGSEDCHV